MRRRGGNVIALPVEKSGLKVEQAAEAFLERDFSPNTLRNFRSDLSRFCETFEGRPVDAIQAEEIREYLSGLKNRQGKRVSVATHNRHHGTLHNLFEWLIRQGEVDVNPVARLERKRLMNHLPQPLARGQVEALFSRIRDLRERALFSLLYRSGLRVDEALSLDMEDLNLAEGTFRVLGKGGEERTGYLSEETGPLLRRYLRSRYNPCTGPVFASRQGRLSYHMTRVLFNRYAEGLTRPDGRPVTIHQLRHTFGSERAGKMDALVLRDLMGHKSIRTTMRYAQVNPEQVREAFRQYDREAASRPRRSRPRRKKGGR
jgi:integrase/recombinase XerD